jgi:hypothetical protein
MASKFRRTTGIAVALSLAIVLGIKAQDQGTVTVPVKSSYQFPVDGRHRRGGELPVGRPIGNYSIREHKRGSQYRSGETSSKPTSGQRRRNMPGNVKT